MAEGDHDHEFTMMRDQQAAAQMGDMTVQRGLKRHSTVERLRSLWNWSDVPAVPGRDGP